MNAEQILDAELSVLLQKERIRQEHHIELIASENYVSPAVLAAQGSILTNKYAEGYPGKRYYSGCEFVDQIEELAINRAKKLFKCNYANVQPHSGSQANAAVFLALLNPGDVILGMSLAQGGHLTHGHKVNFSGKIYQGYTYGVNQEGYIDYNELSEKAKIYRPKCIIAGFSAYSRVINWEIFREVADSVGAYLVADIAHVAGLIATGLYPSPFPYADVVTTTTHKTLRGPRGGMILSNSDKLALMLDKAVFPGIQGGPMMHVIAAKAIAFAEALQPSFTEYQNQVIKNSRHLVQQLIQRGWSIVSGGTDNHLCLLDLRDKTINGDEADKALTSAYITANKNMIPNDPRSAFITSGVRFGTPAVTTRGFKLAEIEYIATWVDRILRMPNCHKTAEGIRQEVIKLCQKFPVYASVDG